MAQDQQFRKTLMNLSMTMEDQLEHREQVESEKAHYRDEMEKEAATKVEWMADQHTIMMSEDKEIGRQVTEKMARDKNTSDKRDTNIKERDESHHRMGMDSYTKEAQDQQFKKTLMNLSMTTEDQLENREHVKSEKAHFRDEMEKEVATKVEWMADQHTIMMSEDKEIGRQVTEKMDRDKNTSNKRDKDIKERDESHHRMGMKTYAKEEERKARLDFKADCEQHEFQDKSQHEYQEFLEHEEMKVKRETRDSLDAHFRMAADRAQDAKVTEEANLKYRMQGAQNLLDGNERQREAEREKRETNRQYGRDLMTQIQGNTKRREDEIREEKVRQQREVASQKIREIAQEQYLQACSRHEMEKTGANLEDWMAVQMQISSGDSNEDAQVLPDGDEKERLEEFSNRKLNRRNSKEYMMDESRQRKKAEKEREETWDRLEVSCQDIGEHDQENYLQSFRPNEKDTSLEEWNDKEMTFSDEKDFELLFMAETALNKNIPDQGEEKEGRKHRKRIHSNDYEPMSDEEEEMFDEEGDRELQEQRAKLETNRQYGLDLMKQIEENRKKKEADKRGEQARDQMVMDYQTKCAAARLRFIAVS